MISRPPQGDVPGKPGFVFKSHCFKLLKHNATETGQIA